MEQQLWDDFLNKYPADVYRIMAFLRGSPLPDGSFDNINEINEISIKLISIFLLDKEDGKATGCNLNEQVNVGLNYATILIALGPGSGLNPYVIHLDSLLYNALIDINPDYYIQNMEYEYEKIHHPIIQNNEKKIENIQKQFIINLNQA